MSFTFSPMFPVAKDNTEYELIEKDYVSTETFQNKKITKCIMILRSNYE